MIVDALLAVAGSITGNTVTGANMFANGATASAPNVIDLLQNRDIGEGEDIYARYEFTTAFSGGTSVQFQAIVTADSSGLTNPVVVGVGPVIAVANTTAGQRGAFRLNPQIASLGLRYLTLQAINVGNNTAGAIYGDFGAEIQDGQKNYASGFAVL